VPNLEKAATYGLLQRRFSPVPCRRLGLRQGAEHHNDVIGSFPAASTTIFGANAYVRW
jgi:hypothetical protein